jgi:hypothetical protein
MTQFIPVSIEQDDPGARLRRLPEGKQLREAQRNVSAQAEALGFLPGPVGIKAKPARSSVPGAPAPFPPSRSALDDRLVPFILAREAMRCRFPHRSSVHMREVHRTPDPQEERHAHPPQAPEAR